MKPVNEKQKSLMKISISLFAMSAALFIFSSCCCNYCDKCSCEPVHCYECKPRCCPKVHWWNPEHDDPTFYSW